MTPEEAGTCLKEGTLVLARLGWSKHRARVVDIHNANGYPPAEKIYWVAVRREGRKKDGTRFGAIEKRVQDLSFIADPEPAHIYADYLEEHGFAEAARILREAFPMDAERQP